MDTYVFLDLHNKSYSELYLIPEDISKLYYAPEIELHVL